MKHYDSALILIIVLLVISVCAMIALVVVCMSDDSSSAISQEMHNSIRSRHEGGTGIGLGVDVMSGKMKIGYGVGPMNIISF